ncbi:MAG: barstar family protein [bacterium]|nr:barstar family protein [bacterium]
MQKKIQLGLKFDLQSRVMAKKKSFIAVLKENINNKNDLFKNLAEILHFPSYFGKNWDALWDLLNDFHWIKQKEIILLHEDLPSMKDGEDMKTYINILNDAALSWKPNEAHRFLVIFPENSRETIKNLI